MAGTPFIIFSKRINGADNAFLGVLVVGVRPTYFQHIYQSIASLPDQSFLLLHRDGTIVVRYPNAQNHIGDKIPEESIWHQLVLQGGGHFLSPGYFGGKARLVAAHPLQDYPLVVNVGILESVALASWRKQAMTIGLGTLLAAFCSVLLLAALRKQFRHLAASKATLAEKTNELISSNAKVDAALNNMTQGLVMLNSSARMIVCNQRYLDMYGLSPEIVRPGCTFREALGYRVSTGSFGHGEVEQYATDILAAVGQGAVFSKIIELPDGRVIRVVNQPITDGGWVATHEDITEQKRAEERIAYVASHDGLTGLPVRKVFSERLEQALKRVRRGERLAVLYLDLDHFKRVNDTFGHPIGDKLLKSVADRLHGCIRDIDFVARLSGDEFAIIQKMLDRPADAADLAMRIREAIHEPFDIDGHQVVVDTSIGISIAPNDATELDDLLKTTDIALYEAKNAGRGTFCFYETDMNMRMQARAKLERDLESALANGEFELFYQPIVSLDDNKISAFEALLRWHHPERGLVAPDEFIPVAEEMGLIVPLGEWVLRTACAEAATWPDDIQVAVNLSSMQLANKNLANAVVGAIASAGISANRLELELTESALLENTSENLATLKLLHELGVRFVMDDFGTGYSSLSYLLSFPFHKIKVDRSFIAALSDNNGSHAIVRAITDMAKGLKLEVVAEGVETASQLQQVRMLRCTEAQGYLFSPPRPAAELLQFFAPDAENVAGSIAANACAGGKHGKMCKVRPDLECGHRLTERECDVLTGIMAGVTSKVSARQLNISFRTVELHRARIKEKLGAKTVSDVVQIMLTKGCSPSFSEHPFRQSQSPEIKVAVSPLAGSIKEPQCNPGDHRRVCAVK